MRWKRGNRLRLIREDAAPPRTREIFDDVRQRLGLPAVPAVYRAYAAADSTEYHFPYEYGVTSRQLTVSN